VRSTKARAGALPGSSSSSPSCSSSRWRNSRMRLIDLGPSDDRYLVAQYPAVGDVQARTTRQIPVFMLTRQDRPATRAAGLPRRGVHPERLSGRTGRVTGVARAQAKLSNDTKEREAMTAHKTGSRQEWLAARAGAARGREGADAVERAPQLVPSPRRVRQPVRRQLSRRTVGPRLANCHTMLAP
jgi:hypothetical protein